MGWCSLKGSMATAARTVMVTRTVEMQPSMDSQDSFLKDGMNINGAVARVHTTTEKWKGLRPIIRPASQPTLNLYRIIRSF